MHLKRKIFLTQKINIHFLSNLFILEKKNRLWQPVLAIAIEDALSAWPMQSWHGSVEELVKYEPIKNKSTRTQSAQG